MAPTAWSAISTSGIAATAIHGNKPQLQRERALAAFREGDTRVLVATDIAARGIDVEGVSHVVNFELPNVPEDYVHRIGRTGRAGATGVAVTFCSDEERPYLRDIEKLTRRSVRVIPASSAAVGGSPSKPTPAALPQEQPPASSRAAKPRPRPEPMADGNALPAFLHRRDLRKRA
jgi:ATP-dependent RNA helicase RhlE